jgi:hypothetical protein
MRTRSLFRGGEPTKRTTSRTICLFVVAGFMASSAYGVTFQSVGPTNYGDDALSATVNPYPAIQVSTIASPPGQCSWINTGLNNFIAANPTNGTGPSGQAWSYSWAGVAAEAQVEAGISNLDYFPYVITQPSVATALPVGGVRPVGPTNELGGAVFNLQYTPQPGGPVITNLHWIQAYTGTIYGNPFGAILDNDPDHPYQAQASDSPFYDTQYFAGTLTNGGGYFIDRPYVFENEYETNPVVSAQFQVVLAGDTQTVVGGVTNNAVTLYGGEWWGFTFSAVDVPEPSAYLLVMLGASGLLFFRRRARKKRAT